MHTSEKIVVAALVTVSTHSIVKIIKNKRRHQAMRAEINLRTKAELAAICEALTIVLEKIHAGEFDGKDIPAVLEDMKFEQIIAFNK